VRYGPSSSLLSILASTGASSVEAGATVDSISAVVSSCALPSLLESSRMIILPSPGDPRMSRLRSLKSFLVISSSREVSTINEEGSSIGIFLEALPCSDTNEQGWRDEAADWDPDGGGDPDGAGGGVSASSGKGLPSTEGERSCLEPLLSSIGG
jgi:hypothetical protein